MAKIIDIHTGKEVEHKIPEMECTICKSMFDLEGEGGTTGYFGMLPVSFCPFCLSSMLDMSQQMLGVNNEEI